MRPHEFHLLPEEELARLREHIDPAAWNWNLPFVVHQKLSDEPQGLYLIRVWMVIHWLLVMAEAGSAGMGIGLREVSRISGVCRDKVSRCISRLCELDLVQIVGYELQDRPILFGTAFPDSPHPDDLFYHTGEQITYCYKRDGSWQQTKFSHPRRRYAINIKHLEDQSFPLFLSTVARMHLQPPRRPTLASGQSTLDLGAGLGSGQGGGQHNGQGWPVGWPGVASTMAGGGQRGENADVSHSDAANPGHTTATGGQQDGQGWPAQWPHGSGSEGIGKEGMGGGAPPGGVESSFSPDPDQITHVMPDAHEERRINPIDAAVIAQEFARLIGMGTPDQLAAGNIQPAAPPDRLAADDEPPPAPPGEHTMRFSLSHLWHELGTAWSAASGRSPRRDLTRLYAMADRIDDETNGFGQYWVARAILDADDVAIRTPNSGPQHGVAYIDAIIQRWKREGSWGSPHPNMGEDQPRGDSKELNLPQGTHHEGLEQDERLLAHPAVQIYEEETGITPTAAHAELICDAFPDGATDESGWRAALKEWMAGVTREGLSYNPRSVARLLNFYHKNQRDAMEARLPDKISPTPFADAEHEGLVTNAERFSWEHINFAHAQNRMQQQKVLDEFEAWLAPRRAEKARRLAAEAAAAEAADGPTNGPEAADEPTGGPVTADEPPPAPVADPAPGSAYEPTGGQEAAHAEPAADEPDAEAAADEPEDEPAWGLQKADEQALARVLALRQQWEAVKDTFDPWSGGDLGPPAQYKGVIYRSVFHAAEAQMADEREQAAIEAQAEARALEIQAQEHARDFEAMDRDAQETCDRLEQVMTMEEMRTLLEKGRREDEMVRRTMQHSELVGELKMAFRQIEDRRSGNPKGVGFLSSELAPLGEADPEPPMPEGGWPIDDRAYYWSAGAKRKWGDSQYFTREELLAYAAEHPQHPEHPEDTIRALGYDPERPLIEQGIDMDDFVFMDLEADKYMWELMRRYDIEGMPPARDLHVYRMKEQQWQTMVEQQERIEA